MSNITNMISTPVKNTIQLISPRKTPIPTLFTGTLKHEKRYLSSQRLSSSPSGIFNNCLKTQWWTPNCSQQNNFSIRKSLTVQHVSTCRNFELQNKVAKCLFSPGIHSKHLQNNQILPTKRETDNKYSISSFDTPHRKLLSPNGLCRRTQSFVLGRGSYGVVIKGKYKKESVAVKVIEKINLQHVYQCLEKEKNALNLKHPNIVQVFKVITQQECNMGFVIMEFCGNNDLEQLLQNEVIPLSIKLKYLNEIGCALEYCHQQKILHLDLKPKNIIVDSLNNTCKLCDFGSSEIVEEATNLEVPMKGTLKYLAPELLKGRTATEKSDIYSFGITMWQIIYQEIPYNKEDLHSVVYKVIAHGYRPSACRELVPMSIRALYQACWNGDPTKRPSSSLVLVMLGEIEQNTST